MCYFGVTNGEQETGLDSDVKPLYLMHLSREKIFSYNMKNMMDFVFETVNNDTRLLPGYRLHVVNGFTYVSVSYSLCTLFVIIIIIIIIIIYLFYIALNP